MQRPIRYQNKVSKLTKEKNIDDLATEADQASRTGNMKDLYGITKTLAGRRAEKERPVKDKSGKQLEGEKEQRRKWKAHFEELLNRPTPPNPPDITPKDEDQDIDCGPPRKEEIKAALKQLKNVKSVGPGNISAEALKADIDSSVSILYPLFQKMGRKNNSRGVERRVPHQTS